MTSFKSPASFTPMQWAAIGMQAFSGINTLQAVALGEVADAVSTAQTAWNKERTKKLTEIEKLTEIDYGMGQYTVAAATAQSWRKGTGLAMHAGPTIDGMLGIVPMTLSSIAITPDFDFYGATYDV